MARRYYTFYPFEIRFQHSLCGNCTVPGNVCVASCISPTLTPVPQNVVYMFGGYVFARVFECVFSIPKCGSMVFRKSGLCSYPAPTGHLYAASLTFVIYTRCFLLLSASQAGGSDG